MDIDRGTGIFSMTSARTGAKHLYAIEMSDIAE
jgi:predicted RNA methylase